MPIFWRILRRAALNFLEIKQVFLQKFTLPDTKSAYTREPKDLQNYCVGFLLSDEAPNRSNAMCIARFGNEVGRQKYKQENANLFAREYKI